MLWYKLQVGMDTVIQVPCFLILLQMPLSPLLMSCLLLRQYRNGTNWVTNFMYHYTKQDSKDTMMNYYVTSIANASWQMLAAALYYCGEQTALKKVKAYFQRQRGMRWRHQLPGHLGIEYSA